MDFNLDFYIKKAGIDFETFDQIGLTKEELIAIRNDYRNSMEELEPLARYIVKQLHNSSKVHSIRYRIKNEDHLIAKIIRKKVKDPLREISLNNYKYEITDLIGVRILHLFKKDWLKIHKFIKNNWNFYENRKPLAYYKEGDYISQIEEYKNNGLEVREHPHGYRSVHYIVETKPGKELYLAEIQIRTIFEEAWSEIDHTVRYPDNLGDGLLEQYLVMFNGLVGSADEMGSYVVKLKKELITLREKYRKDREKKVKISNELKDKFKDSKFAPDELKYLEDKLDGLIEIPIVNPKAVLNEPTDSLESDLEKDLLVDINKFKKDNSLKKNEEKGNKKDKKNL